MAARLKQIARAVFASAKLADDGHSPLWTSYIADFSDEQTFVRHWPTLLELARSGRRDWFALEMMKSFPEEVLDIVSTGLSGSGLDMNTVQSFAELFTWYNKNRYFSNFEEPGYDIPF